jgi:hypothetical protein
MPITRHHCVKLGLTMPHHSSSIPVKTTSALKLTQWLVITVVVGAGAVLALTNPKQEAYTTFATQTVSRFLVKDLCRANDRSPKLLDSLFKDGCQVFMRRGEAEIRTFVTHNTERQDFILFSLYTTEFPIRPLRVLGIFNQFFVI